MSNNKSDKCHSFPALLSDGREFTSYLPRKDLNDHLMKELKVSNNNKYREFLQNNGQEIVSSMQKTLERDFECTDSKKIRFKTFTNIDDYFNEQMKKELSVKYDLN